MTKRPKRERGGQPNNKNARTHGFYEKGVSSAMRNALRRAAQLDDSALIAEIRLARARISGLIGMEPENHDVLQRMLGTLTRMVAINYNLSRGDEHSLGTAMQELLMELLPDR